MPRSGGATSDRLPELFRARLVRELAKRHIDPDGLADHEMVSRLGRELAREIQRGPYPPCDSSMLGQSAVEQLGRRVVECLEDLIIIGEGDEP